MPVRRVGWRNFGPAFMLMLGMGFACQDPRAFVMELCENGIDDDLDGIVDCADSDCATEPACATPPGDVDWLEQNNIIPVIPEEIERDCSDAAVFDPWQPSEHDGDDECSLFPDDCGFGLRCIALSEGGEWVKNICVRQGCAEDYDDCDRRGVLDRCPRDTVCLDAPSVCRGVSCCVPLCARYPKEQKCDDCRAYADLFEKDSAESLDEVGICLTPPPHH